MKFPVYINTDDEQSNCLSCPGSSTTIIPSDTVIDMFYLGKELCNGSPMVIHKRPKIVQKQTPHFVPSLRHSHLRPTRSLPTLPGLTSKRTKWQQQPTIEKTVVITAGVSSHSSSAVKTISKNPKPRMSKSNIDIRPRAGTLSSSLFSLFFYLSLNYSLQPYFPTSLLT